MQFATYADFRNAFLTLLTGDSATDGALDYGQAELLIQSGEDRVINGDGMNLGLRAGAMVAQDELDVSGGFAILPDDFLEALYFEVGDKRLEVTAPIFVDQGIEIIGQELRVTDLDQLTLYYYARPEALSANLHATFRQYPMLYLYSCLLEGAEFLGLDNRAAAWNKKYVDLLHSAKREERLRISNAGAMRIRAR